MIFDDVLEEGFWQSAAQNGLVAALALVGAWSLGPGGVRASLGGRWRLSDVPVTLLVGVLGGAVKWMGMLVNLRLFGHLAYGAQFELTAGFFLRAVTVSVVLQEWLYRGATFEAASRLLTPRGAVLLTSTQFALVPSESDRLP